MNKGFTIIEMVVVIVIISVLSLVVIANFGSIRLQFALTRAANDFAQNFRDSQNRASAASPSGLPWANTPGWIYGYGIYINFNTLGHKKYVIYADTNNNQQYDQSDSIIETVDMSAQEPGVIIKQVTDSQATDAESINTSKNNLATSIGVPDNGDPGVEIVFSIESDPSKTKTVTINNAGLVQIK